MARPSSRITTALRFCPDLPTPPVIAMRIVELARDPELNLGTLVDLLAQDPALSARLMRASNSCLFPRRHKSESLRQAIVVIGLNVTMTLALSFSLARTLQAGPSAGRARERSWRRVLIASCAARLIAERMGRSDKEELALAALLQDIGILALCAALTDEYEPLLEQASTHDELLALEREHLGTDHGEAGSWLMAHWQLPTKLASVPACVHGHAAGESTLEHRSFHEIIEVAGRIADLLLDGEIALSTDELLRTMRKVEGLDRPTLEAVLEDLSERLPELAELYETEIISEPLLVGLIDQARHTLAERELMIRWEDQAYEEMRSAGRSGKSPSVDSGSLDQRLQWEYRRATGLGYPLALAFIRVDDHARLLERHGAATLGSVCEKLRERLSGLAGQADLVFPVGLDEFVALLPEMSQTRAKEALDRLREATSEEEHRDADGQPFGITLTIGMACHMDGSQLYARADELLGAADQAIRGPVSGDGDSLTLAY